MDATTMRSAWRVLRHAVGISCTEGPDSLRSLTHRWKWPAFFVGLLFIAYLPSTGIDFAPQDQWRAFQYSSCLQNTEERRKSLAERNLWSFYVRTGRPLVYFGEYAEHMLVRTIADLRMVRWPTVVATAIVLLCVGRAAGRGEPENDPWAYCFAFSLVVSPAVSFMVFQGLTGMPVVLTLGVSALSFVLLDVPTSAGCPDTLRRVAVRYACSGALFVVGMCTYPPWAMIVVPLVLLWIPTSRLPSTEAFGRAAGYLAFYAAAAVLYYGLVKTCVALDLCGSAHVPEVALQGRQLDLHPLHLWKRSLQMARHLERRPVLLSFGLGGGFAPVLAACYSLSAVRGFALESPRPTLLRVLSWTGGVATFVAGALSFAVAPWIATHFPHIPARADLPATIFFTGVALRLLWTACSRPSGRLATAAVLAFAVLATVQQNRMTACETSNSAEEIAVIRDSVRSWVAAGLHRRPGLVLVPVPTRMRSRHLPRPLVANDAAFAENCRYALTWNPAHGGEMLSAILVELGTDRVGDCTQRPPLVIDCDGLESAVAVARHGGIAVLRTKDPRPDPRDLQLDLGANFTISVIGIEALEDSPPEPVRGALCVAP